jgi:hypothetical protein
MGLIPSKNQWDRWSLPSKLTAIGTLLGLISLLISFFTSGWGQILGGPKNKNKNLENSQIEERKYNQRVAIVRLTEILSDIEKTVDLIISFNDVIGVEKLSKEEIVLLYSSLYAMIREGLDNPYVVSNDTMFNNWRLANEQMNDHIRSISEVGLHGIHVLEVNAERDTILNKDFMQKEYIEYINDQMINTIKEFDKKILHYKWRQKLKEALE